MRVKQRLRINIAVPVLGTLMIFAILLTALYSFKNALETATITDEIANSVYQRSELRNDYIRNTSERAKIQWFAEHEHIGKLLKSASERFRDSEEKIHLDEMEKNHESIRKLFTRIVENRERTGPAAGSAISRQFEERLLSQLTMKRYNAILNARKLQEAGNRQLYSVLGLAGWGVVCVVAVLAAATIANSWIMGRTIANRIKKLQEGVSIIGEGNLEHLIDIKGDDEFADLSGAFNVMTAKLRASYLDLEKEIDERTRAEEALRKAHDELEVRVRERTADLATTVDTLQAEVAERLRADAALRLANAYNRSLIEASLDPLVTIDIGGKIMDVNIATEKVTGHSREELIGTDFSNYFTEPAKAKAGYQQVFREGSVKDYALEIRHKEKGTTPVLYNATVYRDEEGKVVGVFAAARDITEKLRLESIAEAVNTMDSIGYVFSGVRHEIGNPINSVNMILGILSSKLPDLSQDAIRDYLDRIIGQIGRVEFLLRSLKSFNMYETQEPQRIRIDSFMVQFQPLIKDDLETKGIAIDIKLDPMADTLYADPRALQQVLVNLIANAFDALSERDHPKIALNVSKADGMVRIDVEDNGCGIPQDKVKDLFKPFYTTKATGTGLGLVIVKKMITRMNGTIEIKSRKDIGTVVTISLPEGPYEKH
jgi:PAS domain S-box-containing protein